MSTILTRAGKGSALTHTEMDTRTKQAAQTKAGAYSIAESDNRDTIEYSGSGGDDFTMPDVATVVAAADTGDFEVTFKHVGTGVLGITNTTGADTIDGSTTDIILSPNNSITLKANQGGDGYNIIANRNYGLVTGTLTFSGVSATSVGTLQTITHGLGTDDVDFGCTVRGDDATFANKTSLSLAKMCGVDGRCFLVDMLDSSTIPVFPVAPSAGEVDVNVYNGLGGADDIIVNYWIRIR